MNRGRLLQLTALAAVLAVVRAGGSPAEERPAHNQPAGKAGAAPDLSTARSAALAWLDASWAGDETVAHQVLVDDERQRKFMASPLRFAAARRALEAAAIERFGEAGRRVSGYPDGSAKGTGRRLELKEDGDRATVTFADTMLKLNLQRIDGQWRVDLSEMLRDRLARRVADASAAAAKVAEEVAAEIAAGKFATAEEARKTFRERRLAAVGK